MNTELYGVIFAADCLFGCLRGRGSQKISVLGIVGVVMLEFEGVLG
jgi:hypothetical protein